MDLNEEKQILEIIFKGYDLEIISFELDIPIKKLQKYKQKIEDAKHEREEQGLLIDMDEIVGEIAENEYAKNQSQMITIAMMEGKYEEAKKIGERFKNNEPIQSQMITIAMIEGKYDEAKEIGRRFENCKPIQSQMITIAMMEGRYEEAKKIGERFKNYVPIQSQMITIAIKKGNFEKARMIGERFKESPVIQSQIERLVGEDDDEKKEVQQLKDYNPFEKETKKELRNAKFLNEIKTKIYYEIETVNTQEILENTEITSKEKLYLLLAVYEKNRSTERIKELLEQYRGTEEYKNINTILQRTKSKKRMMFDWNIYDDCLGWVLDENLKNEYEEKIRISKEKKAKDEEKTMKIVTPKASKKKVTSRNTESLQSEKTERKKDDNNRLRESLKVKKQPKSKSVAQKEDKMKQKNNYYHVLDFLVEKRKSIYVKMNSMDPKIQKEGISQWDKLENLIEKTKEQKENIDYIEAIYKKVIKLEEKEKIKDVAR